MGPTNVALVILYQADIALREAQGRYDLASKNVRIQERRVSDLTEKLKAAQQSLRELQARTGNLDLDVKTRDVRIEKLRTQQQNAKNNKEYQAFLIEINTEKVDKTKAEEELMKKMEAVEKDQAAIVEMTSQLEIEQTKLAAIKSQINDTLASLQKEVDALKPARQTAANAVAPRARQEFDRLADRFEGEALSALSRPDPRHEEYVCSACNMDLVVDVYNRLHTRDDLVFCPSCRRMLYIPADLPPDVAIKAPKKEPKVRVPKAVKSTKGKASADPHALGANMGRQSSAVDVLKSITPEPDDAPAAAEPAPEAMESSAPADRQPNGDPA